MASSDHVPPLYESHGQRVTGAPPLRANFWITAFPTFAPMAAPAKNPIQRPSGEKNAEEPPGASLTCLGCSSSRVRKWRALEPATTVVKAMRVPSGEIATRLLKLGTNTPGSGAMTANWVSFRGTTPRYRLTVKMPVAAAPRV